MYIEFTNENKTYKIYNNVNSKVCILDEKGVHPQNILMTLLFNHHMDKTGINYMKLYKSLISHIQKTDSRILLPLFKAAISSHSNENRLESYGFGTTFPKENVSADSETPLLYGKYNKTDSYILQNYELRKKLNIEQTEETEKYISYENVRIKPFYPSKDKNCEPTYENSEMTDENLNRMLLLPEYNRNSKKIIP